MQVINQSQTPSLVPIRLFLDERHPRLITYDRGLERILFREFQSNAKFPSAVGRIRRPVERNTPLENIVIDRLNLRNKVQRFFFELCAFLIIKFVQGKPSEYQSSTRRQPTPFVSARFHNDLPSKDDETCFWYVD